MTMHVDIVSAEESLFSGQAQLLVVAGELGDLGIAPGHAPLLTRLNSGPVRFVTPEGAEDVFYISGGLLEVQPNVTTILADTAVRAKDLDEAAVLEAKKHAEQLLEEHRTDYDQSLARVELARTIAQLRTLRQLREMLKK